MKSFLRLYYLSLTFGILLLVKKIKFSITLLDVAFSKPFSVNLKSNIFTSKCYNFFRVSTKLTKRQVTCVIAEITQFN
jgi:hypothetical protein